MSTGYFDILQEIKPKWEKICDYHHQEVMHNLTCLLTHCPVATAPPMDSEPPARAEVEPGGGAGVRWSPHGHGWAKIRRGLVSDGQRGGLKWPADWHS